MKLNKNKIVVSALALAIGASLAGSVSGTIAWYQYSTRANVSFIGKSGGFSGNLQMRFANYDATDNIWRTRITHQEMNTYLEAQLQSNEDLEILPMTFGSVKKDGQLPANGYIQPLPGESKMSNWVKATKKNYAQFELQLRYNARDGELDNNVDAKNVEENVYLSKLLIQQDVDRNSPTERGDLSDAVRVHIHSTYGNEVKNKLVSKNGKTVATKGKLDLDGDGLLDSAYPEDDEFGFKDTSVLEEIEYGVDDNNDGSQTSYANVTNSTEGIHWTQGELDAAAAAYGKTTADYKVEPAAEDDPDTPEDETLGVHWTQEEIDLANALHGKTTADYKVEPIDAALVYSRNNHLYDEENNNQLANPNDNKIIGKTVASESEYLTVKITIWVEGWQELDGKAIWDTKYINSSFDIGMQFAVQDKSQSRNNL